MDDARALQSENARLREEIARLERDLANRDSRHTIIGLKEMVLTVGSSDRILDINSSAEKFFGIRREEIVGLPVDLLSCPPVEGKALRAIAERVRRQKEKVQEVLGGDTPEPYTITATAAPDGVQFLISDNAARRTRHSLSGYLSPNALEALGRVLVDPLLPRRVTCSVAVAELRVGGDAPAATEKTLRDEWIGALTAVVWDTGATLDGFSGGRVTALFGAPLASEDHALWALNTVFRMKEAHRTLASSWSRRGLGSIAAGFGLDAGEALWSEIGPERRKAFTAIGRPGQRAATLSSLAEPEGVVASSRFFELVKALLDKRPEGLWRPAKFKRGELVRLGHAEEPSNTVIVSDS